jgi:hypothetical protein
MIGSTFWETDIIGRKLCGKKLDLQQILAKKL